MQYVVRLYTGGRKVGTGLLWWEPIGTPLADADGGREPPAEALACGIDQEHAHTAEELRAADVQATFDRITDTLRRSGLLPPESGHEQQGQTPKPTPYTGPSLCD